MSFKIFYRPVLILIILAIVGSIHWLKANILLIYFLRIGLIFVLAIEIAVIFKECVIAKIKLDWIKNILTFFYSIVMILILFEIIFMFLPKTHWNWSSYGSRLWSILYLNPMNSFDFRDVEPSAQGDKKNIFIIGDSFTLGVGIKNKDDRFSDIFKKLIAAKDSSFQVMNLGRGGNDTRGEYEAMIAFITASKISPDYLIVQYFGNDIEKVAMKHGLKFDGGNPYRKLNPCLKAIVRSSVLVNYWFWQFAKTDEKAYLDYLKKMYAADAIFDEHYRDVELFIEFAESKDIPLLFVIFPFMQDIALSEQLYIDRLQNLLKLANVSYINVGDLIKALPISDRIINSCDAHASRKVNTLLGEAIFETFTLEDTR